MAVTDILGKLQDYSNTNLVEIFVPSAKSCLKFKQLSVKQQKDLIKTALDGALSGLTLNNAINHIVLNNSVNKHTFLVTDKLPITIALRAAAMGNTYTNEDGVDLNLTSLLETKLEFQQNSSTIINHEDVIKVTVAVPTLEEDTKINESHHTDLKKKETEVGDMIGSFYVYEIAKFIKNIDIADDVIDFSKIKLSDRVQIVENLPAKLNSQIIEYIQHFRQAETEYLTIDNTQISVDARLFS